MVNIPKDLQWLLDTLVHKYSISGWSLFGGKRQKLVITFDTIDSAMDSEDIQDNVQQLQYKRKSQKQIQRDNTRTKNYVGKKTSQDIETLASPIARQTRSKANKTSVDKECFRSEAIENQSCTVSSPIQADIYYASEKAQSPTPDNKQKIGVTMSSPVNAPSRPEEEPLFQSVTELLPETAFEPAPALPEPAPASLDPRWAGHAFVINRALALGRDSAAQPPGRAYSAYCCKACVCLNRKQCFLRAGPWRPAGTRSACPLAALHRLLRRPSELPRPLPTDRADPS